MNRIVIQLGVAVGIVLGFLLWIQSAYADQIARISNQFTFNIAPDLITTVANANDPMVTALGDTFIANLPAGWSSVVGGWSYQDVAQCFTNHTPCEGNNPDSSYGYPTLPQGANGAQSGALRLNQNDALVIILRTPPQVAYYGFTQYLRAENGISYAASLSDTINLKEFQTDSGNPFSAYAAVVWTADLNTQAAVQSMLAAQGVTGINFMPLPVEMGTYPGWNHSPLPPLSMGTGLRADTFTMLMRITLPASASDEATYVSQLPFFVIKVSPPAGTRLNPAPTVGFANTVTGTLENYNGFGLSQLQANLNTLVSTIEQSTLGHNYTFASKTSSIKSNQIVGWDCLPQVATAKCGYDNHDDLPSSLPNIQVKNLDDVVLVIGVNHLETGKAIYTGHSVYDTSNGGGVASVNGNDLTEASALYWAGVTSSSDPRVQQFQGLYAYAISYDCTGLQYCLQIPAPTASNPIGLTPGSPFTLGGRSYVDPNRPAPFVAPDKSEVVPYQVLQGTHN